MNTLAQRKSGSSSGERGEALRQTGSSGDEASRLLSRIVAVLLAVLGAGLLGLSVVTPAAAHDLGTVDPDGLTYHNCHEVVPFVEVGYEAADALVPDGYTVYKNGSGNANLFLNTISCESITVGGVTVPDVIESHMSIFIVSPYRDDPDNPSDLNGPCTPSTCPAEPPHASFVAPGRHVESPADSQLRLESYVVQWVTNSPEYARWLRRGTGLGDKVRVVPGMVFEYDPKPAHTYPAVDDTYFAKVPPPAPSPFHVGCEEGESGCYAVATEPIPVTWEEGINWWADTERGTVIIHSDFHLGPNQRFGTADGTVTSDDRKSPLGVMFGAIDDANVLSQALGQPQSRQTKRFSTSDQETLPAVSGEFTDILLTKCVRNSVSACSPETHAAPEYAPCTPAERHADLRDEQTVVLDLVSHYGPGDGQDLTTLNGPEDMAALARGDAESRTFYSVYDHAFVSFRDMGMAVLNTGDNGTEPADHTRRRPGKPDLLLYAPNSLTADATDPDGADFPYNLVGWAYSPLYDPEQHPTFLGGCVTRADWFVHERGIHPADTWGMVAVPPDEEGRRHGEHPGQDPILASECDDPATIAVELCPAGIQHPRIWDIHLWLGKEAASISMLSPFPIAGIDPEVGKAFFYPEPDG